MMDGSTLHVVKFHLDNFNWSFYIGVTQCCFSIVSELGLQIPILSEFGELVGEGKDWVVIGS